MPTIRLQDVQHTCTDEEYTAALTYVIAAQLRRVRDTGEHKADLRQDCFTYYWERDLRRSYKTDMGTKFSSWMTTCVFRFLCEHSRKVRRKYLDPVDYARHKADQAGETCALQLVTDLRAAFGDRVVDAVLLRFKTPSSMRRGTFLELVKEMRDYRDSAQEEKETGSG